MNLQYFFDFDQLRGIAPTPTIDFWSQDTEVTKLVYIFLKMPDII